MTLTPSDAHSRSSDAPVIAWLLDSDPSIRWQVLRDLTDTPAEIVAAERSRVASEGWGPRLLDQQRPDGNWGDGVATPLWWSNLYTLLFLRDLGVDPTSAPARAAIDLVRNNVTWGPGFGDSPFFEAGVRPERQVEEAVAIVRERRQSDGRWRLDVRHRDSLHEELSGSVGAPNRWITLRALRVLDWARMPGLNG